MDERGVYGRSEILVSRLSNLSKLHNMLCDALKHWRKGDHDRFFVEARTASDLHKSVVQTQHHRQFPDILAIALLFERHGLSDVRVLMTEDLYNRARENLGRNDLRINMFQELLNLPVDTDGHLYLAYDACCRRLWKDRATGTDDIRAYYAYNQASFPRAMPGQFYNLYQGKTYSEIYCILQQVDSKFTVFDHARICLWHTAIRYLLQEQRYQEAEAFSAILGSSLMPNQDPVELYQQRQLNVDTSLTFFLLGSAQNSTGKPLEALNSFEKCVNIRSMVVPDNVWDPTLASALEKLGNIAGRISDFITAGNCKLRLSVMYSTMETEDLEKKRRLLSLNMQ